MLEKLHQTTFADQLDTEFQIIENEKPVCSIQLAEVLEHTNSPVQEAFSLIFHGPLDCFIPQGLRRLRHGKLGEMDIFLVPVGKKENYFEYEAVFNHLIQPV